MKKTRKVLDFMEFGKYQNIETRKSHFCRVVTVIKHGTVVIGVGGKEAGKPC